MFIYIDPKARCSMFNAAVQQAAAAATAAAAAATPSTRPAGSDDRSVNTCSLPSSGKPSASALRIRWEGRPRPAHDGAAPSTLQHLPLQACA